MKLVVWKLGPWRPSHWEDGDNMVVAFKGIDKENNGKTYHLNLNSEQPQKASWLDALHEGNVLDVVVLPGTTTIAKFSPFKIIRKVDHGSK